MESCGVFWLSAVPADVFAPVAPTAGHPIFFIWSQLVRAGGLLHFALPEYYQYLVINYIVFPFLTYLAFCAFAQNVVKNRSRVLAGAELYAFRHRVVAVRMVLFSRVVKLLFGHGSRAWIAQ